jgi:acyl-homoserine-lactone acylase
MRTAIFIFFLPFFSIAQENNPELSKWQQQATRVRINRDNWNIPHIYGKTDADAVFGLMYAQCEENFPRIERNYLEMMGRLSEVEGRSMLYEDLEMRLIYDSAAAMEDYKNAPAWFQKLLNAFADGINYYLYKHPEVHPLRLTRFEPWFALLYTDGSISPTQTGGLTLQDIRNAYPVDEGSTSFLEKTILPEEDPSGSNDLPWHLHVLLPVIPFFISIHMLLFTSAAKCTW